MTTTAECEPNTMPITFFGEAIGCASGDEMTLMVIAMGMLCLIIGVGIGSMSRW